MPSNLKKLIRAKQAETGMSYQAALNQLRKEKTVYTTRKDYLSRFATLAQAMDFEHGVLTSGREFLPPCALDVLDQREGEPPSEYWDFLIAQIPSKPGQ